MRQSTSRSSLRIAHVSDLHFGRIAHPAIVRALLDEINEGGVSLVVVSGDLTQRARPREYRRAAAMLAELSPPHVVVPGNHDVYPWWYPLHRLVDPLRRFRRFISGDPAPTFVAPGLVVMGINSAYGPTVKGGRIRTAAITSVRPFFELRTAADFKVLVVHHHLTRIQAIGRHDVARRARLLLNEASAAGVDLVLCGHLHVSHIEPVIVSPMGWRVVVASAGTATSSRGRGSNARTNFYNVVSVSDSHFEIEERRFDVGAARFESFRTTSFPRQRSD